MHHLCWGKRWSWNTSREKRLIPTTEYFGFTVFSWNSPLSFVSVELFSFLLLFLLVFRMLLWKLLILMNTLSICFALANIYSSGNFSYVQTVFLFYKLCLASWNKKPSINCYICPYQRLRDRGTLWFLILNNLLALTPLMPFYHPTSLLWKFNF